MRAYASMPDAFGVDNAPYLTRRWVNFKRLLMRQFWTPVRNKGRCPHFIAVAPVDPSNPEDVDTTFDNHLLDCLIFVVRNHRWKELWVDQRRRTRKGLRVWNTI